MDLKDNASADDNNEVVDPAAEFLAQEKAILGDLEAEITSSTTTIIHSPLYIVNDKDHLDSDRNELPACSGKPSTNPSTPRNEPEPLRKWREEQKKRLEEMDREEERKIAELRVKAKNELNDLMRQNDITMARIKVAARNARLEVESLVKSKSAPKPRPEYQRVSDIYNYRPKVNESGRDVSRMRSTYMSLIKKHLPIPEKKE